MGTLVIDPVSAEMTVDALMSAYRQTIPVFIRHRMLCVGCPVGALHTIRDACLDQRIELGPFLRELNEAIATAAEGFPTDDPGEEEKA